MVRSKVKPMSKYIKLRPTAKPRARPKVEPSTAQLLCHSTISVDKSGDPHSTSLRVDHGT